MKKILLPGAFIVSSLFCAQSSELTGTTWNLKKVIRNNVTYTLPQNGEMGTPTLKFTPTPGSSGSSFNMSSPICGSSVWAMLYQADIHTGNFTFWTYGIGNNSTCTTSENINFFGQYSNYFAFHSETHNYEITYSGTTKNLVLTNNLGDKAFYESGSLATHESLLNNNAAIKVYPNPVKDNFLEIKGLERIEWTKIYDSEGRLIRHHSSDSKIDVSGLSTGGYVLEVKSQKGLSRHKFIRE
ncbi:hypothetical protein B0A69_16290 [Chryseobacterium shigense]|uniref:Por secretion system C-terminal sorting domain-containing protein n=1 Tax=Chryseobacterium shigense TaxID=297244 RepID=A0A1N7HWR6_9FLAO|nr:T9SS type A sorting domain-containing protein [Chryseobacterium shigense]PQA91980.1 hypothetical protein B0A69_16290 [Chryseobacterium shigense]SIS29178.1 Por secretion system C-terminal sorting domain-containing protein [Chryseobacterium shigense]